MPRWSPYLFQKGETPIPLKSEAQRRWAHSPEGTKALGGESAVTEWEAATPKNIPERVKKKKPKVNQNLREADFRIRMKK